MGRLTLNVLLSFAQFERELSSERVRDKIAASRRKGKWTGGSIPLGYDVRDKKLVPNPTEQKTVQYIFRRYLELGSFEKLIADLDHNKIVSKRRQAKTRAASGGIPFTYGPLAYVLKNRVYLGEMSHKDLWFPGEQAAIVDRKLFDDVQTLLATNAVQRVKRRSQSGALLMGKLYDDRGNHMSPSFSSKNGVRYQFYVSAALLRGRKTDAGSIGRVAASDIEAAVMTAVRQHDQNESCSSSEASTNLDHVTRIEVGSTGLRIKLKPIPFDADGDEPHQSETIIEWPWQSFGKTTTTANQILPEDETSRSNSNLIQSIVRAHAWIRQLTDGTYTSIEELARAAQLHPKIVRQSIKMAFLPRDATEAALQRGGCSNGRQ